MAKIREAGRRMSAAQVKRLETMKAELESLLKWASYDDTKDDTEDADGEDEAAEGYASAYDRLAKIRASFQALYNPADGSNAPYDAYWWVYDIFESHPDLGQCLIVYRKDELFAVPWTENGSEFTFAPRAEWVPVVRTYVPASGDDAPAEDAGQEAAVTETAAADLVESAQGRAIRLVEKSDQAAGLVPLTLEVQIIRPGFGNARDRHYYSEKMLKECAQAFVGAKMYESDHRPEEKNTRTWVSTVKAVETFTEDGAPVGTVVIHDQDFAQRVVALDKAGLLDKLECSILASGTARKGKIDGQDAKIVEAITTVESVDWVTRAGAGGKALKLSENEVNMVNAKGKDKDEKEKGEPITETEPAKEVILSEGTKDAPAALDSAVVRAALSETSLPKAAQDRLASQAFATGADLQSAIAAETAYLKEVTGSGQPFLGGASAPEPNRISEQEYTDRVANIFERYGISLPAK